MSFSLCVEALLDPGPANLIPNPVNIYQQQGQLNREEMQSRRDRLRKYTLGCHEHNFTTILGLVSCESLFVWT